MNALREYYSAEKEAALLQQPAMPVYHSKAAGEGTSIIALLEVIESDFAKDLATKTTEETVAAEEYDKMTQANKVTKTMKEQAVAYQTQEFKTLDKSIADSTADKETMATEQSAVLEYWAKLEDRCIAKPETYETRKARREAEIAGLKEALKVLEEDTALVQRGSRGVKFLAPRQA